MCSVGSPDRSPMTRQSTARSSGVAAVATSAVAVALARRRRALRSVAPDLRVPALYVPLSLRGTRTMWIERRLMSRATAMRDGIDRRDDSVPGLKAGDPPVDVIVYERRERAQPSAAVLWIHGGGLFSGEPQIANDVCSQLAGDLNALVVNVDYRLAPEQPYPASLHDCYAALCWLAKHADALGVDPHRIAVCGGSAGGGLAACVAQLALDQGGPSIAFQALKYPMLDDRTALRTDPAARAAIVWTALSNRNAWTFYLGRQPGADDDRPYVAASRRRDLSGLPPAWIGVGDIDLFHDEDVDYARRLRAAGVPCELHVVAGMYHTADTLVPGSPSMIDFSCRLTDALRTI